jgi:recombinational DNA repair protein RecR
MIALTAQFILLTTGVGALMILVGIGRGLLQARSGSRRCPSCGRLIEARMCRTCTRKVR